MMKNRKFWIHSKIIRGNNPITYFWYSDNREVWFRVIGSGFREVSSWIEAEHESCRDFVSISEEELVFIVND